jgi:hypothetical protein
LAIADIEPRGHREGGDALNWQHDVRARLFRERNPEAVNGAMDAVLCDDGTGRLARVLEFLMTWMTEIQDTKFSQVTESTRRIIQKRVERIETWNAQHEFSPEKPDSRIPELSQRVGGCDPRIRG